MCFDWRVLTGLGAVGLGVWLLAPQYVLSALPLLLVLACPLSMVVMAVMMRGSMGMGGAPSKVPPESAAAPARGDAQRRLALLELRQDELSRQIAAARRDLQPDAAATSLSE